MHRFVRRPAGLFVAILATVLAGCGGGGGGGGDPGSIGDHVEVPANPNDQWTLVAPASVGMDAATLAQAGTVVGPTSGVSGMLVVRHGQPVFEQYWNGFDKDTLHDIRSDTKSITSLLMGIAIDQGLVSGVDEPIDKWLGADYPNAPTLSRGLTLENLLTMRSGQACDDWDVDSPGREENMYASQDWVAFWLDLPALVPPDTTAHYCTGNPMALGRILADATGQSVAAFAQARLLGPLGITSAVWGTFDNGTQTDTGNYMHMRPRDMVKIGQLALNHGSWNGTQLVSSAWMTVSTSRITEFDSDPDDGYGYLWWHGSVSWQGQAMDLFYANGSGGQYIFVVPQLDLVAVFTGENYADGGTQILPFSLLQNEIVDAVAAL